MESREEFIKKIALFLGLTFVFSSFFYYVILSAKSVQAAGGLYTFGLMWCPGLAALITQLVYYRTISGMGWRLGKIRYQAVSYLLPIA